MLQQFMFHKQKQVNVIQHEFYNFARTIKDIFVKRYTTIETNLEDN